MHTSCPAVVSSISFASSQGLEAHSFRCSDAPHKISDFAGGRQHFNPDKMENISSWLDNQKESLGYVLYYNGDGSDLQKWAVLPSGVVGLNSAASEAVLHVTVTDTVNYQTSIPASDDAWLIMAWYGKSGRMFGLEIEEEVNPSGGTLDIPENAAYYKVFLVEPGTFVPLCAEWSSGQ